MYLHPADNYSLRCVQSVAACPSLLVNMSIDGTLSQIREMISIKWKTTMERLELKSNAKNNLVKIDEIQRHKGKLIVHWTSTKLDEPGQPLGDEDPSLLTCYLANDQPEKFVISYRFKRNRPLCEPVQLLAKVGYVNVYLSQFDVTRFNSLTLLFFSVRFLLHRNNQRCRQNGLSSTAPAAAFT